MSNVLGIGATIEIRVGSYGKRDRWRKVTVLSAEPDCIEYRYADGVSGVLSLQGRGHVLDLLGENWRWPRL